MCTLFFCIYLIIVKYYVCYVCHLLSPFYDFYYFKYYKTCHICLTSVRGSLIRLIFTALHGMQMRSCDEIYVRPSIKRVHCDKTEESYV